MCMFFCNRNTPWNADSLDFAIKFKITLETAFSSSPHYSDSGRRFPFYQPSSKWLLFRTANCTAKVGIDPLASKYLCHSL